MDYDRQSGKCYSLFRCALICVSYNLVEDLLNVSAILLPNRIILIVVVNFSLVLPLAFKNISTIEEKFLFLISKKFAYVKHYL